MLEPHLKTFNLRVVHYFITVAELGSISAAAAALGIAQPSLSENIAKLERYLGVELMVRGSRGIQLTEAGSMLLEYGRDMRQGVTTIIENLRQLGESPSGQVSFGMTPSLAALITVPMVETIQLENPQLRLYITEGRTEDLTDWVLSERLDVALVYDAIDNPKLSFKPVSEEQLYLVTAKDNWNATIGADGLAQDAIQASDLAHLPLVMPSSNYAARRVIDSYAKAHGEGLNLISDVHSLSQTIEMVARASAYAVLPHTAVAQQVAEGTLALVKIENPAITRTAYLVRKRARAISQASAVLENTLATLFAELVKRYKLTESLRLL